MYICVRIGILFYQLSHDNNNFAFSSTTKMASKAKLRIILARQPNFFIELWYSSKFKRKSFEKPMKKIIQKSYDIVAYSMINVAFFLILFFRVKSSSKIILFYFLLSRFNRNLQRFAWKSHVLILIFFPFHMFESYCFRVPVK